MGEIEVLRRMQKRLLELTLIWMLTLAGCVSIPAELFTVGQRSESRILQVAYAFDLDQLTHPLTTPSEAAVELDSSASVSACIA